MVQEGKKLLGTARIENAKQREAAVEKANGVGNKKPLIGHAQNGNEDARCGVSTPDNG